MRLQLAAPYWAGSTVLITSQATRAQGLLKGVNRVIGTVLGTFMGVALIALFPQDWSGYILAHTAWLALCTFVSCLLRDQQAYAAALSGYTTLIVAFDSFGVPSRTFTIALSRGSAVILGVTLFTLTLLLLAPSNDAASLSKSLRSWIDDGLGAAARLKRGTAGPEDVAHFMPKLASLDGEIENGATEAPWIGPRKRHLRGAVLALVDCLMNAALEPADLISADHIDRLRREITTHWPCERAEAASCADYAAWPAALRDAARARAGLGILQRDRRGHGNDRVRRTVDRDFGAAWLGALRTALCVGSACAVWVVTRWDSGSDFVLVAGIICCLFASRPSPVANGMRFAASTMLTACCALLVGFYILPLISGFPSLAAALFPVFLIGALGVRSKLAAYFTPLNFFFLTMTNVDNVMNYDPLRFFNSVTALIAGALYATLWFHLVPPLSPAMRARSLRRRLFRDAPQMNSRASRPAEARLLFAIRLGALLPLTPEGEHHALVADALQAWRQARGRPPV